MATENSSGSSPTRNGRKSTTSGGGGGRLRRGNDAPIRNRGIREQESMLEMETEEEETPRRGRRSSAAVEVETGVVDSNRSRRGGRRKRKGEAAEEPADDDVMDEEEDMAVEEDANEEDAAAIEQEFGENIGAEYYDPEQDMDVRRWVRKQYRGLIASMEELQQNQRQTGDRNAVNDDAHHEDILSKLEMANQIYNKVKNPNEAALDSRFLVLSAGLSARRAKQMQSELRQLDIQEFARNVLRFLQPDRDNVAPARTVIVNEAGEEEVPSPMGAGRRRPPRNVTDDEFVPGVEEQEEDDDHDLNWAKLGQLAQRYMTTAPNISFMLGPLSVEKRKRVVQRHAKLVKDERDLRRPEELKKEDIEKNENETTRNIRAVHERLAQLGPTPFWQFVINPDSFSQTAENTFYVAFLAKDGRVSIEPAEQEAENTDGVADTIITAVEQASEEERAAMTKYQHMVSLDMQTWRRMITKYNIRESKIPARKPVSVGIPANAKWYG